jgi:hypothetical protein
MRLLDIVKLAMVGLAFATAAWVALKRPLFMAAGFGWFEATMKRVSANRVQASAASMLVGLVPHVSLSCLVWWPRAAISDEFSYLLQGDTFAQGRLANPPHPMGRYLETPFVLQQPSYASMYPPGQGLFLALGQQIGSPVYGVWLSVIVAALAVYYLLLAGLPSEWAFCGALLFTLHPLTVYWGQNFWGGAVQTTGGALVLGALVRACRSPGWR